MGVEGSILSNIGKHGWYKQWCMEEVRWKEDAGLAGTHG